MTHRWDVCHRRRQNDIANPASHLSLARRPQLASDAILDETFSASSQRWYANPSQPLTPKKAMACVHAKAAQRNATQSQPSVMLSTACIVQPWAASPRHVSWTFFVIAIHLFQPKSATLGGLVCVVPKVCPSKQARSTESRHLQWRNCPDLAKEIRSYASLEKGASRRNRHRKVTCPGCNHAGRLTECRSGNLHLNTTPV